MRGFLLDEPAVLDRIHDGDADAFGALFDLHHDRVFRQALRLTSSVHDAEDVTAVVFLEAWRRRDAMRVVNGSVIGWLLLTANNVHRNHLRSSRRYREALGNLPAPEYAPDHSGVVDDRLDTDARRTAVRAALARLPKRDQDIITLCVFEELSTADAAEALGVAPGTVKSRLSRAKARLAELLGEDGAADTNDRKNGGER
ncbi:RNA polymerase sigma factor [Leifsonia aquatica]|uniref:Sigma-70 region 2 n=2 Tax=Leifsonia aquatica TaxID=144185 RepID=U2SYB0_LEIAQ|nr:RNA polymerase sigma factor [Leifsonia aquatica]ERK70243.1 Sigma-70 region 2 [Leifsonia aquatica ATCC 14665]MBB2968746.1 RNA polymerase sigma-70 factor (ECF subfamily) [Leifsonia aquatica]